MCYGKVSAYFEPVNNKLYKIICYLNSTHIKVNTECCDRFIEEKNKIPTTVKFTYNNKKEIYVCTKMPILATQNMKDKGIFNTMEFVIEDIKQNQFKINNEWFDKKDFSENFIPMSRITYMMSILCIKNNCIQHYLELLNWNTYISIIKKSIINISTERNRF